MTILPPFLSPLIPEMGRLSPMAPLSDGEILPRLQSYR